MIFTIEAISLIILFTLMIVPNVLRNPIGWIFDYPDAIQKRCIELGLITKKETTKSKRTLIIKLSAVIIFALIFALLLRYINGITTFTNAFITGYLLFLIVNWYDALILDCVWFCHSKKIIIPGTEDMKEYKDYWYHIKGGFLGMIIGLIVCLIAGGFVVLL
ncbi:MAG: hypothetical protein MJ245_05170 [Clostridia bacterium]|nr:hypothetical protein [Clostridia bacterium]